MCTVHIRIQYETTEEDLLNTIRYQCEINIMTRHYNLKKKTQIKYSLHIYEQTWRTSVNRKLGNNTSNTVRAFVKI